MVGVFFYYVLYYLFNLFYVTDVIFWNYVCLVTALTLMSTLFLGCLQGHLLSLHFVVVQHSLWPAYLQAFYFFCKLAVSWVKISIFLGTWFCNFETFSEIGFYLWRSTHFRTSLVCTIKWNFSLLKSDHVSHAPSKFALQKKQTSTYIMQTSTYSKVLLLWHMGTYAPFQTSTFGTKYEYFCCRFIYLILYKLDKRASPNSWTLPVFTQL